MSKSPSTAQVAQIAQPAAASKRNLIIAGAGIALVAAGAALIMILVSGPGEAKIEQQLYDDALAEARTRATPVGANDAGPIYVDLIKTANDVELAHGNAKIEADGFDTITLVDALGLFDPSAASLWPPLTEPELDEVATAIRPAIAPLLRQLQTATQATECHIPTKWYDPEDVARDLPMTGTLAVAKLGLLGALLALRDGDPDLAVERIGHTVTLGVRFAHVGTMIYGLVGIAVLTLACDAITGCAHDQRFGSDATADARLARLDEIVSKARRERASVLWSMRSEYVFFVNACESVRRDLKKDGSALAKGMTEWIINADLTRGSAMFRDLVAALELPPSEARARIAEVDAAVQADIGDASPENPKAGAVLAILIPGLVPMIDQFFELDARLDGTRIALALERERLASGTYPTALNAIAARVTPAPTDPFSNKPFIYRRTTDGYTLYAPGPNATDDNGSDDDIVIHPGE